MNKIIVQDNFLKYEEIQKCIEIVKNNQWKYYHTSSDIDNLDYYWNMNLIDNEYLNTYIKKIIEKTFSKKFKINRLYANGQTYGQNGCYHTDSDEENTYTFCLYLTKLDQKYIEIADGFLYFDIPNLKYKICYEPLFNRGIFFPSNYYHKASSFSRYFIDMRIVISWKLKEIL